MSVARPAWPRARRRFPRRAAGLMGGGGAMDDGRGRALVLGGGGVAGIAWKTGFLAGAADGGVDLVAADLVVGTSSGANVAAQVTSGVGLRRLLDAQLDSDVDEPDTDVDIPQLMREVSAILAGEPDPIAARRRIGAIALATDRVPESERRRIIEARLPVHEWPRQLIRVTAVNAATGELVVFDRDSGVSLVDAVTASGALPRVWPAATIAGQRDMDGGTRALTN